MSSEEDGLGNAGTVSTNEQEHSLGLDLAIVCSDLSSAFRDGHTVKGTGCSPSCLKDVQEQRNRGHCIGFRRSEEEVEGKKKY